MTLSERRFGRGPLVREGRIQRLLYRRLRACPGRATHLHGVLAGLLLGVLTCHHLLGVVSRPSIRRGICRIGRLCARLVGWLLAGP
ncbi:MAG: hypothetical protein ACRDTD_29720 [Pseudonocardiaceae bacterium]